jgi:hypothetical protein
VVAVEPDARGMVVPPIGESGLVAGLSETVALGRATVPAAPPRGMVGVGLPASGEFAGLSAMVGAPIGDDPGARFVVANLIVGVPVGVGVPSGLVGEPIGTRGLVIVPDGLGGLTPPSWVARGMVGAPVARLGLVAAGAVGVRGLVAEPDARGIVGAPITKVGLLVAIGAVGGGVGGPLIGMVGLLVLSGAVAAGVGMGLGTATPVEVPDAPAIFKGMVGAGAGGLGAAVAPRDWVIGAVGGGLVGAIDVGAISATAVGSR